MFEISLFLDLSKHQSLRDTLGQIDKYIGKEKANALWGFKREFKLIISIDRKSIQKNKITGIIYFHTYV